MPDVVVITLRMPASSGGAAAAAAPQRKTHRFHADAPLREVLDFVESDEDVAAIECWSLARADVQPPRALARDDEAAAARSLREHAIIGRVLLLVRDDEA